MQDLLRFDKMLFRIHDKLVSINQQTKDRNSSGL